MKMFSGISDIEYVLGKGFAVGGIDEALKVNDIYITLSQAKSIRQKGIESAYSEWQMRKTK